MPTKKKLKQAQDEADADAKQRKLPAPLGSAALDSSSPSHHLCKVSTTDALAHREAAPPLAATGSVEQEQSQLQSRPPPTSLASTANRGVAATSSPLPAGEARPLFQTAAEALAHREAALPLAATGSFE